MKVRKALTIAGSDSGGGAGIQADLKTFTSLRVYGMSVLTSVTAQNTLGVHGMQDVALALIGGQIDAVFSDLRPHAVKSGMLSTAAIVELVAARLRAYRVRKYVLDPVMVSKSGDRLLQPDAVAMLKTRLMPIALIVTPNIPEAEMLTAARIRTEADMIAASRELHAAGCRYVVLKGGHLRGPAVDIVYDGRRHYRLPAARVRTRHTHGTGCTFSAAITAYLARGEEPLEAIRHAKAYVTAAIRHALAIGRGHGPLSHFVRPGKN